MKINVFVKPNEQSQTCLGYAMARKGRMKSNFKNSIMPSVVSTLMVCANTPSTSRIKTYHVLCGFSPFQRQDERIIIFEVVPDTDNNVVNKEDGEFAFYGCKRLNIRTIINILYFSHE